MFGEVGWGCEGKGMFFLFGPWSLILFSFTDSLSLAWELVNLLSPWLPVRRGLILDGLRLGIPSHGVVYFREFIKKSLLLVDETIRIPSGDEIFCKL